MGKSCLFSVEGERVGVGEVLGRGVDVAFFGEDCGCEDVFGVFGVGVLEGGGG